MSQSPVKVCKTCGGNLETIDIQGIHANPGKCVEALKKRIALACKKIPELVDLFPEDIFRE